MSEKPSSAAAPPKKRWSGPKIIAVAFASVIGGLILLVAAAIAYTSVDGPWASADLHHQHVVVRIKNHALQALQTFPGSREPADISERGRYEILRAINTAMGNWPFYYRQNCIPEKVKAIADRLDATQGADMKTFEGCCRLLVMCDEASWMFYDYPWIGNLHEMEESGAIPHLPPLGEIWKDDPRRKAAEAEAAKH